MLDWFRVVQVSLLCVLGKLWSRSLKLAYTLLNKLGTKNEPVLKPGDRVMSLGMSGFPCETKRGFWGPVTYNRHLKSCSSNSKALISGTVCWGRNLFWLFSPPGSSLSNFLALDLAVHLRKNTAAGRNTVLELFWLCASSYVCIHRECWCDCLRSACADMWNSAWRSPVKIALLECKTTKSSDF